MKSDARIPKACASRPWLPALLLAAGCSAGGGGSAGGSPSPTPVSSVAVVMTTHDQQTLMAAQPAVDFSPPVEEDADPVDDKTIIVDENQRYQAVLGFGAAFVDSSTYVLHERASDAARDEAMNNLFTRNGSGIGLSAMRTTIGSSDLSLFHYSYDDMPPGQTDPTLANFSIDVDREHRIPIIRQALRLNPQMRLLASAWSVPGWMKSNDSLIGGTLLADHREAYANYFVRYLQAYAAEGITVHGISHQNEPELSTIDYPGMAIDSEGQANRLRDDVLPALREAGLDTQVLIYDHNWERPVFPLRVLSDPVLRDSDQIAGTAWHWYGGTPGVMTTVHNLHPDKANYVTEASSGSWIADPVTNDFEMIIQSMRNWSRTFIKWALALDENRGPHTGGCATCTPLVTVNSQTGALSYEIDYYTLGHFSKYVLPEATRIHSSNATGLLSVAFLNPDGSKALIVFNDTDADNPFRVAWGTQSFSYTLPRYSGATFSWSGTQTGTYQVPATMKIHASSYNDVSALQTETTSDTDGGYNLGYGINASYAKFQAIDFGAGVSSVEVRVANAGNPRGPSNIDFRLDSPSGPVIASVEVPDTGGLQNWTTVSGPSSGASGIHDVYVVFRGEGTNGNLNWFKFGGLRRRHPAAAHTTEPVSDTPTSPAPETA